MSERVYGNEILEFWEAEIRKAEHLVETVAPEDIDENYVIKLDPEDFLDLCAGRWHELDE